MAEVILKDLYKIFDNKVEVVQNLNLHIQDNEFMVLVGPSGCGKSTTLRMIAGLEDISRGEIYIDKKCVNTVPPKDRDIAMVFQNYALYPHMTVYENMAFGLKLRKYPKAEIKERVHEASDILGLSDFLDRRPKALSGGQRQRVAVGRAIVRKPKVFLFDEPLSNLDAKLRVQMRIEISKLHQRLATTMIYVTHDQVEAMTMGNRIAVMKDGILQQVDQPMNLYERPSNKFVAGFIGSPAMNFFEGKFRRDRGIEFESDSLRFVLPESIAGKFSITAGRQVVLGVRPEHFSLVALTGVPACELQASVDVVEPMGNEFFIYLSRNRHTFIARSSVTTKPSLNSALPLFLPLDRIHLFDGETSQSLRQSNG
jgi:multiple sugar transport system ATP-binding protein